MIEPDSPMVNIKFWPQKPQKNIKIKDFAIENKLTFFYPEIATFET